MINSTPMGAGEGWDNPVNGSSWEINRGESEMGHRRIIFKCSYTSAALDK